MIHFFKFIWFEDLKRENFKTIKEMGSFLGYDLTRDQVSLKGRVQDETNFMA